MEFELTQNVMMFIGLLGICLAGLVSHDIIKFPDQLFLGTFQPKGVLALGLCMAVVAISVIFVMSGFHLVRQQIVIMLGLALLIAFVESLRSEAKRK